MDLLEYQGKQLFARHGVPVPKGAPASTVEQAVAAADELGYPCVVKAQVLIGGRGKAGGIKLAGDRREAEDHARAILGMDIRGFTVHEVWVEAASDIASEYYASIVFDRAAKKPLVMLSTQGGMDIEEVAERDPSAIAKLHVDPLLGFQDFHARRLAFDAGVDADVIRGVGTLLSRAPIGRTTSASTPASKARRRAWKSWKPSSGSTCRRAIASGSRSATSSMSMPPCV